MKRSAGPDRLPMIPRLVAELNAQFAESAQQDQAIEANLRGLGYGG